MITRVILTTPIPTITAIVKVVGNFCNLRCSYCYYHGTNQFTPQVMSDELLEKFIYEYMKIFSGRIIFIWHGGEPLLAGLRFFQKVVELQKKYLKNNQKIENRIQTNGTLIDDEWGRFFKDYKFRVGISIDGIKEIHDCFRKTTSGKGSFNLVMKGIEVLRSHDIRYGILQTLTKDSLLYLEESFNFFVNCLGVKVWAINPYLDIEMSNREMINQNITNEKLIFCLKKYINLWLKQNDSALRIREIDNFSERRSSKKI